MLYGHGHRKDELEDWQESNLKKVELIEKTKTEDERRNETWWKGWMR